MAGLLNPTLESLVGQPSPECEFLVEAGMVRAFRLAVDLDDGLPSDIAPTTFVVNAHFRNEQRPSIPLDFEPTRLNAGTHYSFNHHLRVGDRLRLSSSISAATEKPGRDGPLLFIDTEFRYRFDDGRPFGRCVQTTVHYPRERPRTPAAARPVAALPATIRHGATITSRQLVQWAGASGDFHEIHYDAAFARERGLPGVVITGSLKLALLEALLNRTYGLEYRIAELTVRHAGSDVVGTTLTFEVGPIHDHRVSIRVLGNEAVSVIGHAVLEPVAHG